MLTVARRAAPALALFPRVLAARAAGTGTFSSNSSVRDRPLPRSTGFKFVAQQEVWMVERFGKFSRMVTAGLNLLIPFLDKVAYVQSLKEIVIEIPMQSAITNDNVMVHLDGVLFLRVEDPYKASYGVEDPEYAVAQLAQTTMRSEIGKMNLDNTFKERDRLNAAIVMAMNEASAAWGVNCLRYEIRNMSLPDDMVKAMQMQASAERKKRSTILDSEGTRQAAINIAEGSRQSVVLASEATMLEATNIAKGEAAAIEARATATAISVQRVADAIRAAGPHGSQALALNVAEHYVEAFSQLAKSSTTMLLPSNPGDPAAMVAQALSIFGNITKAQQAPTAVTDSSRPSLQAGKAKAEEPPVPRA